MPDYKGPVDLVPGRGERGPSPLGTSLFVGIRALDGFVLQRALQIWDPIPDLLARLGYATPPPAPTGGSPLVISSHNLTPFQAVLWAMSIGSAVKQIIWILTISKEPMYAKGAIVITGINTFLNSFNTLAFSVAGVNPTWSPTVLYASIPLYVVGMSIEFVAEMQRRRFKDEPKNEGKPFSGGLFAYARSINYFGYMIWRSAFSMSGGGVLWGATVAALFTWDFCNRAIPVMDRYCSGRYGEQWREVKRRVPYAFFPGVY